MTLENETSTPHPERPSQPAARLVDNKFQRLFEHSQDAILIITADGHILDTNGAAGRLLGYTRREFFGLPAEQLIPHAPDTGLLGADPSPDHVSGVEVSLQHKHGDIIIGSLSVTP